MTPASRKSGIALAMALLLGSGAAPAETELDLRADAGYDSNVFNLSDVIGERDGMFTELGAGFDARRETASGWTVGADFGADARLYSSSVSDGNEQRYFARVRGDSGGKRSEHALEWALRYRVLDSTYVSRFTGVEATSGGVNIGDRYDAGLGDVRGTWRLPGSTAGRFALGGSVTSKDYRKDYASLALDRLDYTEYGLEPQYELGKRARSLRVIVPVALRQYRDRRVSDAAGSPVAGSDLEYEYYGIETRYEQEITDTGALGLAAGYEKREDNGVGFGDRKRWNVGAGWTWRPAAKTRLVTTAEWSSRTLNNTPVGDPTVVDESPDKEGFTLDLRYARPFLAMSKTSLLAEAQWESFDNSNEEHYSYDRLAAFVGLKREF